MSSGAYLFSEDSALLRVALRNYSGGYCLEIGAGNGGGLADLSERFGLTVGTDLQPPGHPFASVGKADYVLADASRCFRDGSFDLVAFNPPYLPSGEISDLAVDGGEGGLVVAMHFLSDAMRVLKRGGKIVFLLSSESTLAPVREACSRSGFSVRLLETRRLFYEILSVYEASRAEDG